MGSTREQSLFISVERNQGAESRHVSRRSVEVGVGGGAAPAVSRSDTHMICWYVAIALRVVIISSPHAYTEIMWQV